MPDPKHGELSKPRIEFEFTDEGARLYSEVINRNEFGQIAIFVDNELFSGPTAITTKFNKPQYRFSIPVTDQMCYTKRINMVALVERLYAGRGEADPCKSQSYTPRIKPQLKVNGYEDVVYVLPPTSYIVSWKLKGGLKNCVLEYDVPNMLGTVGHNSFKVEEDGELDFGTDKKMVKTSDGLLELNFELSCTTNGITESDTATVFLQVPPKQKSGQVEFNPQNQSSIQLTPAPPRELNGTPLQDSLATIILNGIRGCSAYLTEPVNFKVE